MLRSLLHLELSFMNCQKPGLNYFLLIKAAPHHQGVSVTIAVTASFPVCTESHFLMAPFLPYMLCKNSEKNGAYLCVSKALTFLLLFFLITQASLQHSSSSTWSTFSAMLTKTCTICIYTHIFSISNPFHISLAVLLLLSFSCPTNLSFS